MNFIKKLSLLAALLATFNAQVQAAAAPGDQAPKPTAQEQMQNLLQSISQLPRAIQANVQAELAGLNALVARLEQNPAVTEADLHAVDQAVETSLRQHSRSVEQLADSNRELIATSHANTADVRSVLKINATEIREKLTELERQVQELAAAKKDNGAMESSLSNLLKATIKNLTLQPENIKQAITNVNQQNANLTRTLQEHCVYAREATTELHRAVAESATEIRTAGQDLINAQRQLQEDQKEHGEHAELFMQHLDNHSRAIGGLHANQSAAQQTLTEVLAALATINARQEALEKKHDDSSALLLLGIERLEQASLLLFDQQKTNADAQAEIQRQAAAQADAEIDAQVLQQNTRFNRVKRAGWAIFERNLRVTTPRGLLTNPLANAAGGVAVHELLPETPIRNLAAAGLLGNAVVQFGLSVRNAYTQVKQFESITRNAVVAERQQRLLQHSNKQK
ncbi:MAG TPA: hypothetical protein VGT41_01300 [Candidatus Babeliales bacterium]|nr:hypothetical protein [Candidatus Babeliales bacterium]